MKEPLILSYSFPEGKTKQKSHLNQNKQTNNKKILSSGLALLAQAAAVKPHPPFFCDPDAELCAGQLLTDRDDWQRAVREL